MPHTPVPTPDVDLLAVILELADPDRDDPGDGLGLLEHVDALLGCESRLLRADRTLHLLDRAGGRAGHGAEELAVQVSTPRGEVALELLLRRPVGRPFGEREVVLLELLRPRLIDWLASTVLVHDRRSGSRLTVRQTEILHLVQLGMSNKEIARSLRISTATVRKHLENAYARLGVLSRTAAVAVALGSTGNT